jgi:hypothetical protein
VFAQLPHDREDTCRAGDERSSAAAEFNLLPGFLWETHTGFAIAGSSRQLPHCTAWFSSGASVGTDYSGPCSVIGLGTSACNCSLTVRTLHVPYLIPSLLVSLYIGGR